MIYPGHGPPTTVGDRETVNPFVGARPGLYHSEEERSTGVRGRMG